MKSHSSDVKTDDELEMTSDIKVASSTLNITMGHMVFVGTQLASNRKISS